MNEPKGDPLDIIAHLQQQRNPPEVIDQVTIAIKTILGEDVNLSQCLGLEERLGNSDIPRELKVKILRTIKEIYVKEQKFDDAVRVREKEKALEELND